MPEPKTRKKKKNTAPKGVKARMINPTLDQPTTPFWNPSDSPSGNDIANWLNQQRSQWNYYGYQGTPTVDPYFTRWQQQQPANVPPAATAAPTTPTAAPTTPTAAPTTPTAAPTTPTNVGGGQSGLVPWVNPATGRVEMPPVPGAGNVPPVQQYAPNMTTGGSGSYGNPDYNYWYDMAQNQEQWTPEEQAAYLAQFYGQTDENGNLIGVGNPRWGDPYQVMPYWKYDDKLAITGGSNRRTMSTRNWRTKNRWVNALEDKKKESKEDENPAGNNTIPAWVGPLVSWRT